MTETKEFRILVALTVAVVSTIFIVKCNLNVQNIEHQLSVVEKEKVEAKEREEIAFKIVDSIKSEVKKRDSIISTKKLQVDSSKKELAKSEGTIKTLSQRIRQAQLDKDTIAIVVNCDSLVSENENLVGAYQSALHYADTLSVIYDEQLAAKDSAAAVKDKLYFDMRTSFNKVSDEYMTLYSKSQRSDGKLKKAKTLNKVLGGVVVVLLGTLTISK